MAEPEMEAVSAVQRMSRLITALAAAGLIRNPVRRQAPSREGETGRRRLYPLLVKRWSHQD